MPGFLCERRGFSSLVVNNSVVKEFSSSVVQQALFLTEPSPQPLIAPPSVLKVIKGPKLSFLLTFSSIQKQEKALKIAFP